LCAPARGEKLRNRDFSYGRRPHQAHLGPAKATTATARKLACLVYHLLKYKEQYREPDPATYQLKVQKTILASLTVASCLGKQLAGANSFADNRKNHPL
jgi:hypothetical protein